MCVCVWLLEGHRDWLVPIEDSHLSLTACISAYTWACFCVCTFTHVSFFPLGNNVVMLHAKAMTTKGERVGRIVEGAKNCCRKAMNLTGM